MWWKNLLVRISLIVSLFSGGWALADCPSADLTGDCFVDFEDFALMANQWLTTDPCVPDDMAYIPDGEFEMGDHFAEGDADELPIHTVFLDSFFMSTCEVTNSQYCDFLNSTDVKVNNGIVYASSDNINHYPYFDTNSYDSNSQIAYSDSTFSVMTRDGNSMAEHPVLLVSWCGAVAYCNWRSGEEGYESCYNLSTWAFDLSKHGYRLPTEAEWEYAALGGCYDPYYKYPWCSNTIDCSKACFSPGGSYCNPLGLTDYPYTSPVGYYSSNNYGLFDMAGNVFEWCNDWYDPNYYNVSPYDNPQGPAGGVSHVVRSGAWWASWRYCRVAARSESWITDRFWLFGFRVVLDSN